MAIWKYSKKSLFSHIHKHTHTHTHKHTHTHTHTHLATTLEYATSSLTILEISHGIFHSPLVFDDIPFSTFQGSLVLLMLPHMILQWQKQITIYRQLDCLGLTVFKVSHFFPKSSLVLDDIPLGAFKLAFLLLMLPHVVLNQHYHILIVF